MKEGEMLIDRSANDPRRTVAERAINFDSMTATGIANVATQKPGARSHSTQNNIDFIRLMMAILVIYSHAYPLSQHGGIDPIERFTLGQVSAGTVAVYVFFVLSGYLIAASLKHSPSAGVFVSRRIRRIYPGFIVALAVSAFVITPLALPVSTNYFTYALARHWLVSAITLDSWLHPQAFSTNVLPGGVNGSLWTIRYEFACYLILLCIGSRRISRSILPATFCIAVVANALACLNILSAPMVSVGSAVISIRSALVFFSMFLAGAVAYRAPALARYRLPALVASLVGLGFAARLPQFDAFNLIAPIALTYFSLACAFANTRALHGFASRVGGDYSYGVYLYAFPIQQFVTMGVGGEMNPFANFLIATPISIAAGVASWHYVEKRFISRHRVKDLGIATPDSSASFGP